MKKTITITITDPMQVKIGDKAYFKNCDFGFTVFKVDRSDKRSTLMVNDPLSGYPYWASSQQFDHATREVEKQEWPDPHDINLHVYLGADGRRYIYNPIDEFDAAPWIAEGYFACHSRESMKTNFSEALPMTEMKLVPKEDNDNE